MLTQQPDALYHRLPTTRPDREDALSQQSAEPGAALPVRDRRRNLVADSRYHAS